MFEQAFKNIDDVLWKDAGCTSELDYTEQTSWLLFLKYLDALEHRRSTHGDSVERIFHKPVVENRHRHAHFTCGGRARLEPFDREFVFRIGKLRPRLPRVRAFATVFVSLPRNGCESLDFFSSRVESRVYKLRPVAVLELRA